jgi:hypothetical protein
MKIIQWVKNIFVRNTIKCNVCGKKIKGWGLDGCPTVNEGMELGVMFGYNTGYIHYKCIKEK